MTYLHASVNSWSLGIKTNVRLLLPDGQRGEMPPATGYPVLYLLHGYTGDGSDWVRMSSLERYLAERQLIVVMPDGAKGFYTDTASGDAYWTYLSQELPQLVKNNFPASCKKEHTAVAGLSMGGYGTVKLALRCPEQYGYAASFSGVLDACEIMEALNDNPNLIPHCSVPPNTAAVFGAKEQLAENENDLFALLQTSNPAQCPQLKLYCGNSDFLLPANERFFAAATHKGLPCTLERFDGGHEWQFWDTALKKTLDWLPL